jgi:hypothetical protein
MKGSNLDDVLELLRKDLLRIHLYQIVGLESKILLQVNNHTKLETI